MIKNLTKNKTTLVIVKIIQYIMLINSKNGQIINSGDHNYLIENCGEYKSLYKKQLK